MGLPLEPGAAVRSGVGGASATFGCRPSARPQQGTCNHNRSDSPCAAVLVARPGVTPPLWVLDPETSDAYRTTETHELKLKPGQYKFISFTFDFPFTVSLDGRLEYSKSLDQCVEGRGTQTLVVRCKRTYPHSGQRDAYYGNSEVSDGTSTR